MVEKKKPCEDPDLDTVLTTNKKKKKKGIKRKKAYLN